MGNEDPDVDVAEQRASTTPVEVGDDREAPLDDPGGLPVEADPADVAEQRVVVDGDDGYDR